MPEYLGQGSTEYSNRQWNEGIQSMLSPAPSHCWLHQSRVCSWGLCVSLQLNQEPFFILWHFMSLYKSDFSQVLKVTLLVLPIACCWGFSWDCMVVPVGSSVILYCFLGRAGPRGFHLPRAVWHSPGVHHHQAWAAEQAHHCVSTIQNCTCALEAEIQLPRQNWTRLHTLPSPVAMDSCIHPIADWWPVWCDLWDLGPVPSRQVFTVGAHWDPLASVSEGGQGSPGAWRFYSVLSSLVMTLPGQGGRHVGWEKLSLLMLLCV